MILFGLISMLGACGDCDEGVGPTEAPDAVLLGHAARDEGGARWVFRAGDTPRLFAAAPVSGAFWDDGVTRQWLPATKSEAREGGALTWLAPPPPEAGPGALVLGARRWPARLTRATDEPIDELARLAAAAKAARAAGSDEGYIELQTARGRRALELGVPTEVAAAFSAAAYSAFRTRDLARADRLLARAERAHLTPRDSATEVFAALVRGYVDRERGHYRAALRGVEAHAPLARQHGHPEAPYLDKTAAQVLVLLGRYAEARARMAQLAPLFEAKGPGPAMGAASDRAWLDILALVAREAPPEDEGWASARALAEGALERARALGAADSEVNILSNLVYLEHHAGRPDAAEAHLGRLRAHPAAETGFGARLGELMQGELHLAAARIDAARDAFELAERHAREESEGSPSEYTWRAALGLGRALADAGRRGAAAEAFGRALADIDALSRQSGLRQSRAPFLEAREDAFEVATAFFLDIGEPRRALEVSEQSRAQLWRDFVGQADEEGALAEACAPARELLREIEAATWTVATSRAEAHAATMDAARSALRRCRDDAMAAVMGARRTLDPRAAVEALRPGDALASFVEVRSGARALVVRDGQVHDVAPEAAAQHLEGASHVYLVPGGAFDVPRLSREILPRLLVSSTVSFLPIAARLALPSHPVEGAARVLGDPRLDLPFARREAREVAARLSTTAQLGDAATRAALHRGGYLHFAGHGRLVAEDPWQVGLQLADGPLTLDDLLVSPLGFGRVVLSGCETGARARLGRARRVGLVDAMVLSGARSVVAARTEVDDEDTRAFFAAFYDAGGKDDPAGALRAVARAQPELARPFYVAGVHP